MDTTTARLITKQLFQSSVFQRASTVSCYLSMPSGEVDSDAIVAGILASSMSPSVDALHTS
jgi:hypothetical protein